MHPPPLAWGRPPANAKHTRSCIHTHTHGTTQLIYAIDDTTGGRTARYVVFVGSGRVRIAAGRWWHDSAKKPGRRGLAPLRGHVRCTRKKWMLNWWWACCSRRWLTIRKKWELSDTSSGVGVSVRGRGCRGLYISIKSDRYRNYADTAAGEVEEQLVEDYNGRGRDGRAQAYGGRRAHQEHQNGGVSDGCVSTCVFLAKGPGRVVQGVW